MKRDNIVIEIEIKVRQENGYPAKLLSSAGYLQAGSYSKASVVETLEYQTERLLNQTINQLNADWQEEKNG